MQLENSYSARERVNGRRQTLDVFITTVTRPLGHVLLLDKVT